MRDGWQRLPLGDLVRLQYGKALREPDRVPGGVPVAGSAGQFGEHDRGNATTGDETIVVGRKGTAGSVTYFDSPVWVTDTAYWAEPVGDLGLPMLNLILLKADLPSVCAQTGVPGLNRDRAYQIPVHLPPLAEQRRIVDLIGALDDTIAATAATATRMEDAWWASTRSITEQVGGLPTRALGSISDIHGGLTKNKKDASRLDAVEAPYLRVANVHRRRLDLSEVTTITAAKARVEAAQLLPGDLLMNEGGDRDKLGRGAIWRGQVAGCTHQNHVFRVRVTDPAFLPEFVSAWANSFGQKWFDIHGSQTTGIASISKSTLSRFPVPEVPHHTQARWVAALDALTAHQWEMEALADRLRDLRSNLLTVLLSGEHEIPESYDELLEAAT